VVVPGPDFAVTVSQSVRNGRRIGLFTALGIGCGISVHVAYTLLGVGALMHTSHTLAMAARLLGCAYLLYLAFKLLRAKPASLQADAPATLAQAQPSSWKAFATGFLTNATNPKATLFFLAIFTTLVSSRTPLSVQALYGVWMCSVNAGWFSLVSLLFSQSRVRSGFVRIGHWFERLMGVILAAFAVRLMLSLEGSP
jgi:RhtB (resistance to homoserine/threonine) family protein